MERLVKHTKVPSMGPRLVGRGKHSDIPTAPKVSCLQWGRVLWDAERSDRIILTRYLLDLQWGRVLWDAERSPRLVEQLDFDVPSMGPRLVGRGKEL